MLHCCHRFISSLVMGRGGMILAGLLSVLYISLSPAAAVMDECAQQPADQRMPCYQKHLETILKERGTEAALTALEGLAKQDTTVLRHSHVYAHHLGRVSFSHYRDAATAFSHCRDIFWSGCYHGVLEGYLSSRTRVEPKDIAPLCRDSIDASQSLFLKYQCVHGLGHGLTMYFGHDIFKALPFCDALSTDWDRESCYSGVFMENIVAFQNPNQHGQHRHGEQHEALLKPQDPFYPCNAVDVKYQAACYRMQASAILMVLDQNFDKALQVCAKAPAQFIPTCYESLGREASGGSLQNGEQTVKLCTLGAEQYRQYCFVGAVKDFMLTHADSQRGISFCRTLDASYKQSCYAAVGEVLFSLSPDKAARERACANAEEEFKAVCLTSAQGS